MSVTNYCNECGAPANALCAVYHNKGFSMTKATKSPQGPAGGLASQPPTSPKTTPTRSASPFTWFAVATIKPIQKVGTKEECEEWMHLVLGQQISIIGPDGDILVGIIDAVRAERFP